MTSRRTLTLLIASIAALGATVGFAGSTSAKSSKYYVYKDCKSTTECKAAAYTLGSKLAVLQIGPRCSDSRVAISGSIAKPVRFSKKTGKYSATFAVRSYSYESGTTVDGTATVKGKVSKKKKVTGSWTVDKAVTECDAVKTGKFSAKYKGTQTGG